ncbi:MAG: DNA polymerase III subunit gamma/tau [Verrucomicrobia bacterium]|nr:MAG: DNA polymerase III subunit gamma/tau [Verrucomicrobiota bacterium]
MNYRVFARKYRPQTFDEVIGQDSITTVLRNAIRFNRLAQAYLFVGPRGIGKTSTARILAKALNCQNGAPAEPCGTCDSCVEIADSRSLDVLEIDGASHNGVENIRELRENISFSPLRGPFKIYILDEVHMLSAGAFNALLKTLEEPPSHVKFIFATTEVQKVPATISSRCQRFDLKRIPPRLIASHLQHIASKEQITIEEGAAQALANAADGALRDAESMLDQTVAFCGQQITEADVLALFGLTPRQVVADLSALVFEKKTSDALTLIADQVANGRDLGRLLGDWISWLRDLLIQQSRANTADSTIQTQAAFINQNKLLELLDLLAETQSRMKWASDPQLQMDIAIIRAAHLLERASLDDVLAALCLLGESHQKKMSGSALPLVPVSGSLPSSPEISPATGGTLPLPTVTIAPTIPRSDDLPLALPTRASGEAPSLSEEPPSPESSPAEVKKRKKRKPAPQEASPDLSAAAIWETVAQDVADESPVKFGWVKEAHNAVFDGNDLHVCLPNSFKAQFESSVFGNIQALLEKQISQKRGVATHLRIDFVEAMPSSSLLPSQDAYLNTTMNTSSASTAAIDPLKDFKNDPLIHKALEIFKGTIQIVSP